MTPTPIIEVAMATNRKMTKQLGPPERPQPDRPPLTGLRALRHLDLQLVRVHQVVRRDSESPGGHLLHRTASKVPVGIAIKALLIFATLSSI